MAYYKITISPP